MDLCPVCGAYWECECRKDKASTESDTLASPIDASSAVSGGTIVIPQLSSLTSSSLETIRDEYRERYGGG